MGSDIGRWLPAAAGQAIVRTPLSGLLSPVAGTALVFGYAAVVTMAALRVSLTRDA